MSLRTDLPPSLSAAGLGPSPTRVGSGITYRQPTPAVQQTLGARTATLNVSQPPPQPAVEVAAPLSPGVVQTSVLGWGFCLNPMMIIVLMLIFIVVFIILLATKSNMVTDLVSGERVINNGKLVFWTVLISIVISVLAFVIASIWRRSAAR